MSHDSGQPLPITSPPLAAVPAETSPTSVPSIASYQDVVLNENLFMETLKALHISSGTKFMVPKVGGKPLNLHRLFVEVTVRGGLQRVISDRVWKDVISAFNFPSTITNGSFILRKYYISLLQHYEEVYFFRSKDLATKGTNCANSNSLPKTSQLQTVIAHGNSGGNLAGNPPLQMGSLLRGVIKGKFEDGYLVTALHGSETLSGVLYHIPEHSSSGQALPSSSFGQLKRKRSLRSMEEKISKQLEDLWNGLTQPKNKDVQETPENTTQP
ncbi:hypothetical protein HPP92_020464 [Vanilla planifolia]|uniref:ARID domain-containing protein n=1 Tax=Vanilla planifolia TaxID=51239 RepID=A0A835UKT8_VANPL|nr:hypothetical protein HPP92_020464 [Vanilla planifolia]